ncbi:MAG: FkbM family methyltransferase, partial [Nitrosopumilaceae archaeon]
MYSKNVTFKDFVQSLLTTVYFQSKMRYLVNAKKAYRNLLTVIFHIIKRKYPVRVILKDGRSLILDNLSDIIFMSSNYAWKVCEIKDDLLIIKTSFASVKFSHWRHNGDIAEVWVDEQYKTLPVKNKVVVDIGANIGDSSIYFSTKGASKVLAFEPAPKNYEMLKENITINKITNIEPILAGISSKNHTLTIDGEIASNGPFTETPSGQLVSLITLTELVSRYMISD